MLHLVKLLSFQFLIVKKKNFLIFCHPKIRKVCDREEKKSFSNHVTFSEFETKISPKTFNLCLRSVFHSKLGKKHQYNINLFIVQQNTFNLHLGLESINSAKN